VKPSRGPLVVALVIAAVLMGACSSTNGAPPAPPASSGPPALPAGYVPFTNSGQGVSLALPSSWVVDPNPDPTFALQATNSENGHNWLLILARTADAKPADQVFADYAATQRAMCGTTTVPDTLVVPAGSVYLCRIDSAALGLEGLNYRLPVGRDVWSLTLAFQDGNYSGAGQEEAETILRTLVLTR
jgi:hypothetical protein